MDVAANRTPAPPQTTDLGKRIAANLSDDNVASTLPAPTPKDSIFLSTAAPAKTVKLSFLPQDVGILPQTTVEEDATGLKDGLDGPRVKIAEARNFPVPHPNDDGDYLYTPDDPRFDGVEEYVAANRALKMAEGYLGRDLPWAFKDDLGRNQLIVHPHLGADNPNAFYSSDAGSLNFFSFTDPKTHEVLRSGLSSDVVSHETGHAILDAIRHNYIGSLSMSAAGFHESFADCTALLTALQDDSVIDKMQAETQGDLTQPNVASNLAEALGKGIAHIEDKPFTGALRSAVNDLKYADQHFIPYVDRENPNEGLGQEPHAYSNLFTGAFYDVFTSLQQEAAKDTTKTFKDSVVSGRDTAGRLLLRGMEFAPVGDVSYKDVALAMIKADEVDNGGDNRDLLENVFVGRKILTAEDLKTFDKHEAALPTVKLDPLAVKDKDAAKKFLDTNRDALGIPKDLKPEFEGTHTNNRGETFMLYDFEKSFGLDSSDFGQLDGSRVKATGGLLLAFDKDGKLIEDNLDDVTRRKIEDIQDHLKVAVAHGALSMDSTNGGLTKDGEGLVHLSETAGPAGPLLERSHVIWG